MKKVDKGLCQMLGKVYVKVGHGAQRGAEPKTPNPFEMGFW